MIGRPDLPPSSSSQSPSLLPTHTNHLHHPPSPTITSNSRGNFVKLDYNSGGKVFFCLFRPPQGVLASWEGVLVIKFGPTRLLMQGEQFANELTRHLDICAPDCRVLRQAGPSSDEWAALDSNLTRLGPSSQELLDLMNEHPCMLVMEFVRGRPLLECADAFDLGLGGRNTLQLFDDLGRLFLLDMVLGNPDRLPCIDLGWRGNAANILHGGKGSKMYGRVVAIDSCIHRRPPAALLSREDAAVDRMAQLLLNDPMFTLSTLKGSLVAGSRSALSALQAKPFECISSFQSGLSSCLKRVVDIKGLLEMIHLRIDEWMKEFIEDLKSISPKLSESLTLSMAGSSSLPPSGTFRTNLRQRRRSSVIILPTAEDVAVAQAAEEFYSSTGRLRLQESSVLSHCTAAFSHSHDSVCPSCMMMLMMTMTIQCRTASRLPSFAPSSSSLWRS